MNDRNCRNCGAPVEPGKICEYCGTLRPVPVQSMLRMTADSLTITCDTLQVGKVVSEHMDQRTISGGMGK